MKQHTAFCESLVARTTPWIIMLMVCVIGLFIPIFHSSAVLKTILYSTIIVSTICLLKAGSVKRPVVVLEDNALLLRGVTPGKWKLFQLWVTKRIDDANIVSIKIGYLRERRLGGLISYTTGEPSRGAPFQMLLWVKYSDSGQQIDMYYPHIKNIAHFRELITRLEERYGSRVELLDQRCA